MEVLLLLVLLSCFKIQAAAADAGDGVKGTSVKMLWVKQHSDITLQCNITDSGELAWYHLRSNQLVLLISAQKTSLSITLPEYFNLNTSHYIQKPNNKFTVANLTITMVTTHDLGLYFCGVTRKPPQMHFHSAINVQFQEAKGDVTLGDGSVTVDDEIVCRKVLMFGGVSMAFLLLVMASFVACSIISSNRRRSHKHPSL